MMAYEESLKVYRDLKAVTDTAFEDGYKEAEGEYSLKLEEERRLKEEERRLKEEAILLLLSLGMSTAQIAVKLGLPIEFVESLNER